MHTLEKQCVARQLQSKFQRLHLPCCFVCLRLFLAQKSILHIFCFYVYAQYTNRKPCISKVMQSKFQRNANKISILAFALLLCLLAFIFGTNACFANCFFVWLPCGCSQLCVCKVLSDICCFHHVGTLLRRHFAFLALHFCCFTTQQIRFSVFAFVFNLSTAKNCVCSFLCF